MIVRTLEDFECVAVSGGSLNDPYASIGGLRFPILDNNPTASPGVAFSQMSEWGGTTTHYTNAQGGVTTVWTDVPFSASQGHFAAPNGLVYSSMEAYNSHLSQQSSCEFWTGVAAFGGAVALGGVAASALGGSGVPFAVAGTAIGSIGVIGAWGNGCF
jgi:hypothetical protein